MRKFLISLLLLIPILTTTAQEVDSIIDIRDDQVYKIVKIGQQWWMQENLNIGIMIDSTQDATNNGIIEKYCYHNSDSLCNIYRGLYQWNEMMDYNISDDGNPGITRGICPVGWYIPSDNEWTELTDFLGGEAVAGGKLKETDTTHWLSPNTDATNESRFTALPGGGRFGGTFDNFVYQGYWWSATENYSAVESAWFRGMNCVHGSVGRGVYTKELGFSVRCLRDSCQFCYLTISDEDFISISKLDFTDEKVIDTIIIINSSARETINVVSIQTNTSAYNLNKSSAVLSPGDSIHLYVAFNPPVKGSYYFDTLRIESDDPYNPVITVPLNGYMKTDTIIDIRDGQVYSIVKIGQQWWMQENLNIGTRIGGTQDASNNGVIEKYCYDDIESNCNIYGGLYQWDEMMDYNPSDDRNPAITRGVCPAGWHLSTNAEWNELTDFLGGVTVAGGKLKETGTTHWYSPNNGATNESGFTALPGGIRSYEDWNFYYYHFGGNWWSSTENSTSRALNRELRTDNSYLYRWDTGKEYGFSVRCLRDSCQFGYLTISDENFGLVITLNFYGDDISEGLILINSSAARTINISSIYTNNPVFSLNKSSSTLSPGDSIHFTITFNPSGKDIYPDTLFVKSDDPYDSLITITLNGTFLPEISFTDSTNISCFGYFDGSATITPSLGTPPYHYLWDDPGNTTDSTVTGLSPNIFYHVTVIDSKGYLVSDSIILSEPPAIKILDTIQDVSITGGSDGIIDISVTGGTKPYSFSWSNDSVSEDMIGISTGEYQLILEDHNGCTKDGTFRVKEPISLQFDKIDASCSDMNDGRIDMNILGGNQPYTIEWSNDATTGYIENLQSGKYVVNVTDDFGASVTDSVDIFEPEPLEILYDYSEIICQGSTDGYIDLYPSGGTPPYEYIWSNGASSQTLTDLEAGDYGVKLTDSHECIYSADFTILPAVPYSEEQICIVTVDLLTGENLIIWEKTAEKGIESYNIYREEGLIGTVGYNDLSIFKDTIADPEKRTYLYALSVVDTCGNESELSPYHKPLFLQYVSSVGGVNLSWSKYEIEGEMINFDSYSIYRGSNLTVLSPLEDNIPTEINNYRDNDPQSLLNKFYYRVAGRLTEPCTPTGNLKGVEVDYSLTMSNFDDNQVVSVQDTKSSEQLIVYPNPFFESTTIVFNNPEGQSYTLYVSNLSGKLFRIVNNITSSEYVLEKSDLKQGFYFIELRGPEIYRGKIVIE